MASTSSPSPSSSATRLTITRPDDWHLHVRDGAVTLRSVVPASAGVFGRAVVMPNLVPPVTTVAAARSYSARIEEALLVGRKGSQNQQQKQEHRFRPRMALYLTDRTTPEDVREAAAAAGNNGEASFFEVHGYKLYPAGATTNSDSGVTDLQKLDPTLKTMEELGLPLMVHGEVTDADVDVFDREKEFIARVLRPALVDKYPRLKVVMEHITTEDAVQFVRGAREGVAATITPQHITLSRNALFQGGMRPHNYCLPVLKRERHRRAVLDAATSGSPRFFLGTDSAPHARNRKESSCGCAGIYSAPVALPMYAAAFEGVGKLERLEYFASHAGADFYGLPRNGDTVTLVRESWRVPEEYAFGDKRDEGEGSDVVVPMGAGTELAWRVL